MASVVREISFFVNGVKVSKLVTQSGLTVVLADVEGPLVEGAFVLATEAHDDDGCPHTLEHLVFLGSEQYPYKGILDGLANRCLAQGTNAWTDVDHTAYTLTTAGAEGFLNLLPVYLDHILYPTLTDTGFHTEVHHITGTGEDAGVVYCEMQGRENNEGDLMMTRLRRLMYPGDCGFSAETGGLMANLRELRVEKVRQYHRDFYRPDNMCLIISGKVERDAVLKALAPVEARIASKGPLPKMQRPWQSAVPPVTESVTEEVRFPSDDEESGTVIVAWRGPQAMELDQVVAMKILWQYLTESAVAPLQQTFVEIDDPYCTDVTAEYCENAVYVQYVEFEDVPLNKMAKLAKMLPQTLRTIATQGIDMDRMHDVIHRSALERVEHLETRPHSAVQFAVIGHFLYGQRDDQLGAMLDEIGRVRSMKSRDQAFWVGLINSMLELPCVTLLGKPSKKLAKSMANGERQRVAQQCKKLGKKKLEQLARDLDHAMDRNNAEIPRAIFDSFANPDIGRIPFVPVATIRNGELVTPPPPPQVAAVLQPLQAGEARTPVWTQFDHIPSEFVQMKVFLETSSLPESLRSYLELYLDIIFETPIERDGQLVSHKEIVASLERDTVSYSNGLGIGGANFVCGLFSQLLVLELKLETSKYELGVCWLRELLWQTRFIPERLKIGITKLKNDIPKHKRDGEEVCEAGTRQMLFAPGSNHLACNFMHQQRFLKSLLKRLEDPVDALKVCEEMDSFRAALCRPENIRVHVVADIGRLSPGSSPARPWQTDFLPPSFAGQSFASSVQSVRSAKQLVRCADAERVKGCAIGVAAIESAFLVQAVCTAPPDFQHPDRAALLVLIEYLICMEGVFWKQIRGLGLAYNYHMSVSLEEGVTYFSLSKSQNVSKAYQAAAEIVSSLLSKKEGFDAITLQSARSSVVFSVISREENAAAAATQSLMNYLRQDTWNGNQQLLERVRAVTEDDLFRVLDVYIRPLFDASKVSTTVTLNPTKVEQTLSEFAGLGRPLLVTSLEQHFFGAEADAETEDTDEEDDEDGEDDSCSSDCSDSDDDRSRGKKAPKRR
eukprot:TRINITY_DN3923_c0_g2_i1.p1 TRINITY_DN3923_c0_g2~~TRINITY_DN3923_c0_g2_i1.p1  ORF type:complete len:1064 (+),score=371.04 TRINITY_DN3923_c0_g2_i1:1094-4285(+)